MEKYKEKYENLLKEFEELEDALDNFNMHYLSQISMYKSLYDECKKINEEKMNKFINSCEDNIEYDYKKWIEIGYKQAYKDML